MSNSGYLVANNVSVSYGTRRNKNVVLQNIDFTVTKGELVTIIGPSGAGKSTLAKAISGHQSISSGELLLNGHHIRCPGPDRFVIHQGTDQLFPWKTVEENIMYPQTYKGVARAEAREISHEWLKKVKLNNFGHRYPHELSGGQRQRVALARGYAASPSLLIMDESFSALDEINRSALTDITMLLQRETGMTTLVITHSLDEACKMADRVFVLAPQHKGLRSIIHIDEFTNNDAIEMLRTLIGEHNYDKDV